MATESAQEAQTFHGGRLIARRLKAHGVSKLFTLSGGHIFSIYDGCREEGIEIVERQTRVNGGVRGRGLGEGDARTGRVRADGGAGRDEWDQRDRERAAEPLADAGAGGARAGGALGTRLAAGDRPRAVCAAAREARGDARLDGGDPGPRRGGAGDGDDAAWRPDVRGLPDGLRVYGGGRARGRVGGAGRPGRWHGDGRRGREGDRTRGRAAEGRRAPGDHGGDGPVLGPRRGRVERARADAADPGVPERSGKGLPAGRR